MAWKDSDKFLEDRIEACWKESRRSALIVPSNFRMASELEAGMAGVARLVPPPAREQPSET